MGIVDEDIARVRAATDFVAVASEHLALRKVGTGAGSGCARSTPRSRRRSRSTPSWACTTASAARPRATSSPSSGRSSTSTSSRRSRSWPPGPASPCATTTPADRPRPPAQDPDLRDPGAGRRLVPPAPADGPDAAAARGYLRRERGYDGDVVRQYQLGWAPDGWDQLVRALQCPRRRWSTPAWLPSTSPGGYNDFFRGRLLFPIFERGGQAGRRRRPHPARRRRPKYKNTAEHRRLRQEPGALRAQLGQEGGGRRAARWWSARATPTSSACTRPGSAEAVATCGTALADGHVRLLTNFARRIVLAYDADAPARRRPSGSTNGSSASRSTSGWPPCRPGADPADLARRDPDALRAGRGRGPARTWPSGWTGCSARADLRCARRAGPGRRRGHGAGGRTPQRAGPRPVPDAGRRPLPGRAGPAPQLAAALAARRAPAPGRSGRPGPAAGRPDAAAAARRDGSAAESPSAARSSRPCAWPCTARGGGRPAGGGAVRRCAGTGRLSGPGRRRPPCTTPSRRPTRRRPTCCSAWRSRTADADADDVMIRLVERAGRRALDELQREAAQRRRRPRAVRRRRSAGSSWPWRSCADDAAIGRESRGSGW